MSLGAAIPEDIPEVTEIFEAILPIPEGIVTNKDFVNHDCQYFLERVEIPKRNFSSCNV